MFKDNSIIAQLAQESMGGGSAPVSRFRRKRLEGKPFCALCEKIARLLVQLGAKEAMARKNAAGGLRRPGPLCSWVPRHRTRAVRSPTAAG